MNPTRRALAAALGALCLPLAAQAQPEYFFSPVNQYGISVTAAYWNPIVRYVSERSGVKLQLKIGRTSADTTSYVLAREVDFVFSNHLFSPDREHLGWKVFGRRETPPVRGQIVVPADSPITDVRQLAGKEVAFPGPEATIAYKFTYGHLLQDKVDVKVVFAGNMDAAFAQIFSGRAAAAGANSQLVEGYARREGKAFRVLWSSAPLHDLALMHSSKVPAGDVKAVAAAFFAMANDPQGREVLEQAAKAAGLPAMAAFVPSDGSEYKSYRDFYRSAPQQVQ
ncbi:phosphate/phosphite/phosphonate ABC transporter substrate-binding protein [Piscinibacter terrae]|uniref:ABC transporter substrate-binding protein n=1 Tax=Piscinibacter terrae TaxID=2496871 RepID=A0A3N7JKT8_9BURK|nr:PhnD/SsuA/transferrin family substrate-binding protein [Albitalea terrae]RQP21919.1 ABC transporter substrate-binding protein [Albitalea terrae]